jgi:GTP-binding protein Era
MTTTGTHPPSAETETRSGYVTLLGRPNAGKSTLLNAFLGERLSIVTPKPQTTWKRVTGIWTEGAVQLVFLDTPGLLTPRDLLQRAMLTAALQALSEADVRLLVLDAGTGMDTQSRELIVKAASEASEAPLLVAVNKTDLADDEAVERLGSWVREALGGEPFPTSAIHGKGTGALLDRLGTLIPQGPFLYPADDIAKDPVRFFVAEIVRETVFETFHQEIPYSVACLVEEFREGQDPVYIQVHIYVERNSQKRILVGKKGSSIKALGAESRRKIEDFLGHPVYLDLWVKVLKDWRRKRRHLRTLGYPIPDAGMGGELG